MLEEDLVEDLRARLTREFENFESWLTICNGFEEFVNRYSP